MLKKLSIISLAVLGSLSSLAHAEQNEAVKIDTSRFCYYANKEFTAGELVQSTPEYLQVCSKVKGQLIWLTVDEQRSVSMK
jgi:hypothetical protein